MGLSQLPESCPFKPCSLAEAGSGAVRKKAAPRAPRATIKPRGLPRSRSHSDLRGGALAQQPAPLAQHQALPKHHHVGWTSSRACCAAAEPS